MGALVFKDKEFHKVAHLAAMSIGVNPGPFDCYLALRGVKTLELRVIQGTKSAYHLAHYLEKHELVDSVIYPGLKSNKYH
jgi:cystathionine beta-lyase/cystathionine gamma-synthase